MTTVTISTARRRNAGLIQVFGNYAGDDDRYIFALRSFDDAAQAERYAAKLVADHGAESIERIAQ
jgi:hypothetical protein